MEETKKKKFQMPSSFTILFILTAIVAVLTWLVPAGQYDLDDAGNFIQGTYHTVEASRQGLVDLVGAPIYGMLGKEGTDGAIQVSLFILMVGGFLGVVTETGAIDAGISSLIKHRKDSVNKLIWILMFVFALGGSTYGMAEETMAFYPILIPLMVSVGMDALVAVAVVLVGSGLGVLSSTVNPFATGVAADMAGISMADGIGLRLVFFVVTYFIGAFFVSHYAKKVQEDPKNSLIYDHLEHDKEKFKVSEDIPEMTGKQKGVLYLFALTFIIMILGLIPWADLLGVEATIFDHFHNWLMSVPFLGDFVGQSALPLGSWYLVEITILFFAMAIIIGFYYGIHESRFIDVFIAGMGDLMTVALICAVARGLQVVMNDGQITATVLHWGEVGLQGLSKGVFTILTFLFYIPMSFLIPSTSGLAAATMGIMAPLGEFAGVTKDIVITAFQSAAGIVNLVTPTSGVVMGALAIAGIELGTWWKYVGKIIGVVFVVAIILLWIGTMF